MKRVFTATCSKEGVFIKANVPFLIAGAIATLILVTYGAFMVAPYATIGVTLPVTFILLVLSTAACVFLCKIISSDKTSQQGDKGPIGDKGLQGKQGLMGKVDDNMIEKFTNNFVIRDEVEALEKKIDVIKELAESALEKGKINVNMKFYAVGEERFGELGGMFLTKDLETCLSDICDLQSESNLTRGYVFYGLPGTGKTMFAMKIANKTKDKAAYIEVSASSLFSTLNIDKVFKKAEDNKPCIIFIDEFESIGRKRTNDDKHGNARYLNHLLTKFNEHNPIRGVTVIAATNHISYLDPAIVRSGRFSDNIEFSVPNDKDRRKMVEQSSVVKSFPDINTRQLYNHIIENTEGFSPANMSGLLNAMTKDTASIPRLYSVKPYIKNFKETHNIGTKLKKNQSKENLRQRSFNTSLTDSAISLASRAR